MKKIILITILAIIILGGLFYLIKYPSKEDNFDIDHNSQNEVDMSIYTKNFVFTDPTTQKTANVLMSEDGDSIILNYENIKDQVLNIAMSASGARYANVDESLVFWNKGENGFILLNDQKIFDGFTNIETEEEIENPKVDDEKPQVKVEPTKVSCEADGGVWFAYNSSCEINSLSQSACIAKGGEYNECNSACRHNKEATVCTMQCVMTCTFK